MLELTLVEDWLFILRLGHLAVRHVIDRLSSEDAGLLLLSVSFVRNELFDHVVPPVSHTNLLLKSKLLASHILPVTGFEIRPQGVHSQGALQHLRNRPDFWLSLSEDDDFRRCRLFSACHN